MVGGAHGGSNDRHLTHARKPHPRSWHAAFNPRLPRRHKFQLPHQHRTIREAFCFFSLAPLNAGAVVSTPSTVHQLYFTNRVSTPPTRNPANARMEPRRPPEYTLEVFADPACVKDVVKGTTHLLHPPRSTPVPLLVSARTDPSSCQQSCTQSSSTATSPPSRR